MRPNDFEGLRKSLAKSRKAVALKNEINRCRGVFKYAFDQRLVDRPVHFGQSFDRLKAKTLRKARQQAGPKLYSQDEVAHILSALDGNSVEGEGKDEPIEFSADPQLKAMTLLGLNAGFGNTDCVTSPQRSLDLTRGWIDFPPPKTGVERRVPLWPETVGALKAAIAARPKPKNAADDGLVFLTRTGVRWVRVKPKRKKAE